MAFYMPKNGILNAKKWCLTFMKWTLGRNQTKCGEMPEF